jgi:RNA polymerase sigma-70 factor, ECF subfamily
MKGKQKQARACTRMDILINYSFPSNGFRRNFGVGCESHSRERFEMGEPIAVMNNPEQAALTREQDLIARVQRGQNELFYELVKPYERRVYAAALAILRNPDAAEDVVQEAVVKAFANIKQFRAEARFSTWLTQITVNEALMRRRRERTVVMEAIDGNREAETEYAPRDFADWREIPSEALERKEVRQRLGEALATLDHKYREVFVLRDMEQLNIQETAEALGISAASVKTRLLRARLMLRDLLAAGWKQGWFSRLPFEKGTKPW